MHSPLRPVAALVAALATAFIVLAQPAPPEAPKPAEPATPTTGTPAPTETPAPAAPAAPADPQSTPPPPPPPPSAPLAPPEVRGTWLTTTANDALSTPAKTADTMRRLRAIGLNTVYIECWKNGYTQYPSEVLKKTIGVDRRPALMPQDPSDTPDALKKPGRDLLAEAVLEAHRHGLIAIAWFEYGFMAAHKDTDNHLRRMKPQWLSKDINGNVVAPNNFVWMNPLHPEARQFLLDLVLEAIDKYDLDGVQLDDRIVWPYVTMGYDDYTKGVYASEHMGVEPPKDHKDPAWMKWRADKVNQFAKRFVEEVKQKRPGLIVSVSPAPYPWSYEHYLCDWPQWSRDGLWTEFVPQCYRLNYDAFEKTWNEQLTHVGPRRADLIAGIRIVGDGPNLSWDDLKKSIELTRTTNSGGHVHWFSRGVLDLYEKELTDFYNVKEKGHAPHPRFPADWRPPPQKLRMNPYLGPMDSRIWRVMTPVPADYLVSSVNNGVRATITGIAIKTATPRKAYEVATPKAHEDVEILVDRRREMSERRK